MDTRTKGRRQETFNDYCVREPPRQSLGLGKEINSYSGEKADGQVANLGNCSRPPSCTVLAVASNNLAGEPTRYSSVADGYARRNNL